jgi:hypothetical protein
MGELIQPLFHYMTPIEEDMPFKEEDAMKETAMKETAMKEAAHFEFLISSVRSVAVTPIRPNESVTGFVNDGPEEPYQIFFKEHGEPVVVKAELTPGLYHVNTNHPNRPESSMWYIHVTDMLSIHYHFVEKDFINHIRCEYRLPQMPEGEAMERLDQDDLLQRINHSFPIPREGVVNTYEVIHKPGTTGVITNGDRINPIRVRENRYKLKIMDFVFDRNKVYVHEITESSGTSRAYYAYNPNIINNPHGEYGYIRMKTVRQILLGEH